MTTRFLLSCLLALALLGCDSNESKRATWSYLHGAIVQPQCATAGCHSELTQTFGVNLDDADDAYDYLLAQGFVIPGDPGDSRLMYLFRGIEVRKPMPPDLPMLDEDIQLFENWILAGALRD